MEERRERIEGREIKERESRDERGVIYEREEGDVREERQREWIGRGERGREWGERGEGIDERGGEEGEREVMQREARGEWEVRDVGDEGKKDGVLHEITIHNIISSLFVNENIINILPFSNHININF